MNQLSPASLWILDKYINLEKELEKHLQDYELTHSVQALYNFLWDDYADWYVEYLKTDETQITFAKELYKQFVITISPYMPFESQALWQDFFGESQLLANYVKEDWTTGYLEELNSEKGTKELEKFNKVIELIKNLRSTRGLFRIDPATKLIIQTENETVISYSDYIQLIGRTVVKQGSDKNLYELKIGGDVSVFVDIKNYINDLDLEVSRTNKEINSLEKQIRGLEKKLDNPKFIENADPEMVERSKDDLNARKIELVNNQQKLKFLV